jgi:hypothetical protein
MNGFSAAISGVGSAVGRYFSVVSFIPSLFLTGFIFALIKSGAWSSSGSLDWAKADSTFTHIGDLALLTLISIAIGVAVHPIQFALVQFFEGYWGTRPWAQRARTVRIMYHLKKYKSFHEDLALEANKALREADGAAARAAKEAFEATSPEEKMKAAHADEQARLPAETRVGYLSIADESRRLAGGYPNVNHVGLHVEYDDIMPTRLGNVLRRYERQAGSQYGLDAVSVIQQISFVAPAERLAYVGDQRQLLDLSVRMSATSLIATLVAISALWRHGPWLLLALVPYGVAYLSYRGAVVVAHEYGAAVAAMIDLDRFALYDALRLPRPKDTAAERQMNAKLAQLLAHNREIVLRYKYPEPPESTSGQSAST